MDLAQFWWQSADGGFALGNSLRFRGTQRLAGHPGTSAAVYTLSFWFKIGNLNQNNGTLFGRQYTGSISGIEYSTGSLNFRESGGTSSADGLLRDPSAWYHLVISKVAGASDYTGTVWLNGVQQAATTSLHTQSTLPFTIGARYNNSAHFEGYMAEIHFVDGQNLTSTDFGEFNTAGVWGPKKYAGTYGTNGFYLDFSDPADIGADRSGNGNNWTASGFELTNTTSPSYDWMADSPTTNWCTLNPLNVNDGPSATALSNGNLDLTAQAGHWGTIAVTSGKWYWEVTLTGTSSEYNYFFGAKSVQGGTAVARMMCNGGNTPDGNNIIGSANGTKTQPTGSRPSLPATIGVKLDMDNGDIEFVQGGVVNGKMTGITNWNGAVAPFIAANTTTFNFKTATLNFGQRPFAYTPPTGFKALSTNNLPEPKVKDGSEYFDTFLYNGTNSSSASNKTGGFSWTPDFVWIKHRNGTNSHRLIDAVRGTGKSLITNSTGGEVNSTTTAPTAFTSGGFTTETSDNSINGLTSDIYVAWNWRAGGAPVTNTAGTIPSQVSANPTAGFSIVTWTGTGADGSYGHGLGAQPSMIIHKRRDSTSDWHVWHKGLPTKNPTYDVIYLNLTDPQNSGNGNIFRLDPTSTLIYAGSASSHNVSGATYVDYVFSEVEGYSKFGSYTGNNSTDGPFVWCGFKPRWLMIRRSDSTESWLMFDTARETYNPTDDVLYANLANAEAPNYTPQDFTSNGFKIRTTATSTNASGGTYIYMAFAEHPFGGANVSPSPAR